MDATPSSAEDPNLAAAITHAEERRAMLRLNRNRIRDEVWQAANETHLEGDPQWELALIRLHERLNESETYDHLINGPLHGAVAAICKDLGLTPDWSTWSDERGFARDLSEYRFDPAKGWIDIDEGADEARDAFEARPRPVRLE